MALSTFADKAHRPDAEELLEVLGKSAGLWKALISHVSESYPPITELWAFPGPKFGWSLRLKRKDRVVLYMIPQAGHFLLGVVLGEKAVKAANEAQLPARVLELLNAAPRYVEGRGIRVAVRNKKDVAVAEALAALKMDRDSSA